MSPRTTPNPIPATKETTVSDNTIDLNALPPLPDVSPLLLCTGCKTAWRACTADPCTPPAEPCCEQCTHGQFNPSHLAHYGLDLPAGEQLSADDYAAAIAYEHTIFGLDDALECTEAALFLAHAKDFGHGATIGLAHSHFAMLRTWYDALDGLYGGLSNRELGCRMGNAGWRYITAETNRFFHALNLVRREVCIWLVGTAGPRPGVDSGRVTFADAFGVLLDGTTVAESR